MALGIRGSNPVWSEFDLNGNIFDDTFYMYVLQNTIPYVPATVYHDPDLSLPWTNPIRFLGNGTLPVDIFFESEVVYRLEFRQNDGLTSPSQSDPLIYEINNYIAGSGGSNPVDTVAMASSNQITNPQFALINFTSPLSLVGATNPPSIEIGPGWFLDLTGTGNATITQVPLNNANENPSNAPYALQLTLSGWATDGVVLRQRFQQNGMLWANKIVSSTVTARLEGSPQSIAANLVDSNGSTLAQVLPITPINEQWNEFTSYGDLPATTNPDLPPVAYIEYKLEIPSNIDIYLTSFQLVVQDLPIEPSFEQDSIERQIDHTYHDAYPIIPVGAVIDFASSTLPTNYLACDGSAISRTTYRQLFAVIGITWGAGDGSTTFNLPNLNDMVIAGSGGTLFGGAVGSTGGSATHTLLAAELPPHQHDISTGPIAGATPIIVSGNQNGTATYQTGNGPGTSTPFSIVQQTAIMKKIIRYR